MSFEQLGLLPELLEAIRTQGYESPTPIQSKAIPVVLTGEDVLAGAQTGTGKTAAFVLPMLQILNKRRRTSKNPRALVLTPTRELAAQIEDSVRTYGRHLRLYSTVVFGGVGINPQIAKLRKGVDLLVATPGRLLDHVGQRTVDLSEIEILVLDEADRMLDMGFYDDIMRIIDFTPSERQTLLFSATFPKEIKKISQAIQHKPEQITVESIHDENNIKQFFFEIEKHQRSDALIALLQHYTPLSTVVFCNRKQQCKELAEELWREGFHAVALHGDLEQKERDQKLVQFSNKSSSILIATDVAARGLDIKDLQAVINFELSPDPEIHIHRIGRTGRAGNEGLALSLFTPSEISKVNAIEDFQKKPVQFKKISSLIIKTDKKIKPPMVTLCINAGRKNKVRAGDILGALTKNTNLAGKHIGKIDIFDIVAYVAIEQSVVKQALKILSEGKIKGRKYRVRKL